MAAGARAKGPAGKTSFRCECDTAERTRYKVTSHEGKATIVEYCDGCHDLAKMDWTGETARIEIVA